jgi:uncharacterized cupredoxin-like copper-binding protein
LKEENFLMIQGTKKLVVASILLLALGLLAACGSSNAQEVKVSLGDFSISSATTNFVAGKTYRFVVTNNGKVAHEFMVMPPSSSSTGHSGHDSDDMHSMALAHIENIAVGETKTVEVTFPASIAGQSVELSCQLPGHYEAGMKQTASVGK